MKIFTCVAQMHELYTFRLIKIEKKHWKIEQLNKLNNWKNAYSIIHDWINLQTHPIGDHISDTIDDAKDWFQNDAGDWIKHQGNHVS